MVLPPTVGIGWRPALAATLLRAPEQVGFVEVVAEAVFAQGQTRRELVAATALWPVVPHGVKMSLASPDGVDAVHVGRLAALARQLGSPCVSEHLAITRGGDVDIGHLTPMPRTPDRVAVIAHAIVALREKLGVPLLVENIAAPFAFTGGADVMDEGAFVSAIIDATGCGLLLDLSNLYANARNTGVAPLDMLTRFPLHAVGMIHIAGGVVDDDDGFYHDTHAHPIPEAVFELLVATVAAIGPVPVLVERDATFDDPDSLFAELGRCRGILAAAPPTLCPSPPKMTRPSVSLPPLPEADTRAAMLAHDRALAVALTRDAVDVDDDDDTAAAVGIDTAGLRRTRRLLTRKRTDDALPLLPRLAQRPEAWAAAARALIGFARRPSENAVRDAWHIAAVVANDTDVSGAVRDDAVIDGLLLRARFHGDATGNQLRQRALPFVGRATLSAGRRATALKGPGAGAGIRLHETQATIREHP